MGLKWNIDQIYCNNKSQRPSGHPCNSYNHDWDDADDDDNLVFHFSKVSQTKFFHSSQRFSFATVTLSCYYSID